MAERRDMLKGLAFGLVGGLFLPKTIADATEQMVQLADASTVPLLKTGTRAYDGGPLVIGRVTTIFETNVGPIQIENWWDGPGSHVTLLANESLTIAYGDSPVLAH